jgi:phage gpG-like protein
MNYAQLGYVHEYGSPKANIPARPFLEPGVEEQRERIGRQLQKAAKAAMNGDAEGVQAALNGAGQIATNSARNKIATGEFVPLSPATIRNRRKVRGTKSMRAEEKKYLELIASGATPEQAQDEAGIRPLNDTGQLRNSLTYVIRKKE